MESRDVIQLLGEIRDTQREHLAEYQRVTQEQLELSRRAVQRQEQIGRLYQRVVLVGALVVVAMGLFLAWTAGAIVRSQGTPNRVLQQPGRDVQVAGTSSPPVARPAAEPGR